MTFVMLMFSLFGAGLSAVLVDALTSSGLGMPGRIGSGALGGVNGGCMMLARSRSR